VSEQDTLNADGRTLAVIGSRSFPESQVEYVLAQSLRGVTTVVSGGAKGVDSVAERFALASGLTVVSYRPKRVGSGFVVEKHVDNVFQHHVQHPKTGEDWHFQNFRAAALRRNWWIVRDAASVLAFWDGDSTGTAYGIAAATRLNRELRIWMDGDS
jgi:hypothetical protein